MSHSHSSHPVAIVTGASRGIGRGIAIQLAGGGYDIVVNYFRNAERAGEVVDACCRQGANAVATQADVGEADGRLDLIEAAHREFGRLDVLVNNAGITSVGRRDVLDATEESWDRVMATNLKGPFFLAQAAAREMIATLDRGLADRKTIVNVSSISAIAVSTNRADYCIAKSAMKMMTELFATRLAGERIYVYEVCPGVIESDMTAPVREKYDEAIQQGLSPIMRWGTPSDVAQVVVTLVSGGIPFSTGDRVFVDGGFHIRQL